MPKLLAYVQSWAGQPGPCLHYWHSDQQWVEFELDSPLWFEWLTQAHSFRYTYYTPDYREGVNFTVRAEKRGQRTYWQGWKTIAGQTTKKYLGPSPKLTRLKLDTAGDWFGQQVKANTDRNQNGRLYAIAVDLIWLAERLLEGCHQPQLVQQAEPELTRLKREVNQIDQILW